MNSSLFRQFFFAFSAVTLLVLVTVLFYVNWSFERGFHDYLLAEDKQKLSELGERMAAHYEQQGDWQGVLDAPGVWSRLLTNRPSDRGPRPPAPPRDRGPDRDGREALDRRPPPPQSRSKEPLLYIHRVALLDTNGEFLMGSPHLEREIVDGGTSALFILPLQVNEALIGKLALQPPEVIDNKLAQSFQNRQISQLLWVAPVVLLLGLLAAALLVRHFLRPIKSLAAGTRVLAGGDYSHRLAPAGRDELAQLAGDFNQLAETLETEQRLRHRWIADTSHELRTPLAVLRSEIEAIQDGIRKPEPKRISALHAQVLSLSKLVDDLHQLSLGDAGQLHSDMQPLNISDLLQGVVLANESNAAQNYLSLELQVPDEPLMVRGDTSRLLQLFNNLVGNSLRHTSIGGMIEITASAANAQVIVEIADTAPGVSDEALPRLFERLYRPDESRNREDGGAGLGLSIAEQIAQAHGGELKAEHSSLGGLKLSFTMPSSTH